MRFTSFISILLLAGCVDRIEFDIGISESPVVVTGFISDEPGPYTVEVSKAIESDSKTRIRDRISVKRMILSDSEGLSEQLTEITTGIYKTSANGIRGKIGNAYSLTVEFLDGRIFQSTPDTLVEGGRMDSVYFDFREDRLEGETRYGFDIFFDSSTGDHTTFRYLWKLIVTFQVDTNPELHTRRSGESQIPDPRPCSGFVVGTDGNLEEVGPCECCTCWISRVDALPIVSDNQLVQAGAFRSVKAGFVPVEEWIFQNKVHAMVRQQSLSPAAYAFWKAVIDQKQATESLFQPVTGRVPTNFVQIAGQPGRIEGLFYASSISTASVFITRGDVPDETLIREPPLPFTESCLLFADHATNQRPDFWK